MEPLSSVRPLAAAEILDLWEALQQAPPGERPLVLAAAASGGRDRAQLAALPLGALDALLMALRERTFGPQAEAVDGCPSCGALLEAAVDLRALREAAPAAATREYEGAGVRLRCRLPSLDDVQRAAAEPDDGRARELLLRSCVTEAERGGTPLSREQLPAELLEQVARLIEEGDPLADVRIALRCPDCGHGWDARFDITSFLLAELRGRSQRLLGEVHQLARAYGWSEREILALSPWRRRAYLEAVAR
jgi:hypothetical protein